MTNLPENGQTIRFSKVPAAAAGAAAGDAAWDAAGDALAPTRQALQQSALQLVERMIALTDAA